MNSFSKEIVHQQIGEVWILSISFSDITQKHTVIITLGLI